jgi:hypothetical protein
MELAYQSQSLLIVEADVGGLRSVGGSCDLQHGITQVPDW